MPVQTIISPHISGAATSLFEDEVCGCIFQKLHIYTDRIEVEVRGLKLTPLAPPEEECIKVICTDATLLNAPQEVESIEALPDWRRQIDDILCLAENTLYLAMTGGAGLVIQSQSVRVEHLPLES